MFPQVTKTKSIDKLDKTRKPNVVAQWLVPLCDRDYVIEFEHGTATGKRVITINREEILRREWMFKLVGDEVFTIGASEDNNLHTCIIQVEPKPNFLYEYTLLINGVLFEDFIQRQCELISVWKLPVNNDENFTVHEHRIALNKISQDLWLDGTKVDDTETEFIENGTLTKFQVNDVDAIILGTPQPNAKRMLIKYDLYINCVQIEPVELVNLTP